MRTNWVLLADDDLEDQEMLVEVIREMAPGVAVETVSDGREVLSKLAGLTEAELPSLIILDYKMPYLNAAEVLEALAEDPRYAAIPKVCWSSSRREDDIRRCLKAGACNYFAKPSTTSELRQVTTSMLECRNSCRKGGTYTGK
ncbi:MAG TPA: response regulator [Puia sp.]|nr:response regulator [Puia sp.]